MLIAGVNAYPHLPGGGPPARNTFGPRQLGSEALTCCKVYNWLLAHKEEFPVALVTVRGCSSTQRARCWARRHAR